MNVKAEILDRLRELINVYELLRSPGGRVVSLPSGKGGVGKTLVSLHLGAALSYQGYTAAVLDLNFALPNLHSYAGEMPDVTITHYLTGLCRLEEVKYVNVKVANSSMHIYPSRSIVDLARKVRLEKLPELLKRMKNNYDFVILDLSPGMSRYSLYPVRLSDCVFIVAADERASYLDATKLCKKLEVSGIKISGYIINKFEKRREVGLENVVCRIPFDQSIRRFPDVWNKKFLRPKFIKSFIELSEKLPQIC